MYALYSLTALITGFILDMIFGDPDFRFHPIRLIGSLINTSEKIIRKFTPKTQKGLVKGGKMLIIAVCGISVSISVLILAFSYSINTLLGIAAESIMCYFMIAAKSLKTESMKVYAELERGDIKGARKALSMIVGRDTEKLDSEGIIKAAVETVAENTSDGVAAPMLYIMLFGGAGGVFYKAVNTMDSTVGYKNEKYLYFGSMPALLDDIANYIPSRITAHIMILSAYIAGLDGKNASRIYKRDKDRHPSPNSGHTEAVCAGALGIKLAGSAVYFGKLCEKETIGDEINNIRPENIIQANRLMYMTALICLMLICILKSIIICIFIKFIM